jgi:type II secretory pathway pseudopilin PulG
MTLGAFGWLAIVAGILSFGRVSKWNQAKAAAVAAQQAGYAQQQQYAQQGPGQNGAQGAGVEVPAGAAGSVHIPTLDEDGNPPAGWDAALYGNNNHQRPAA